MEPSGEVVFRTALPADIPALHSLVESAYRGDESRRGWTTEADLLDGQRTDAGELAEAVGSPGSRVLVAVGDLGDGDADGSPLACCRLVVREAGAASFGLFAVRPDLQGRGIGTALLAEAERVARRDLSARVLVLHVLALRAELLAWYRRLGYRPTGETAPFPYGDERFGIPRRADLEFVVLAKTL